MAIESFKSSLSACIEESHLWFDKNALSLSKQDWSDNKKNSCLKKKGAVYAFFDNKNNCLYIGQTTNSLKNRVHYSTSNHTKTDWWRNWKTLKVLNIDNQTDQIILELLLILRLEPKYNTKPTYRKIDEMFCFH